MQLTNPGGSASIRARLGAAACVLLASGAVPARAADAPPETDAAPRWQFDGAGLLYGEKGRIAVGEPMARFTRLLSNGQTLTATFGFDVITGASPTGAIPSTKIQTVTTPSGNTRTQAVGTVPTSSFSDARGSLDLDWTKPFDGGLSTSLGGHVSREKDYRSTGVRGKVSIPFMRRLSTLTLGGSYNDDAIMPSGGGTRIPLTDGNMTTGATSNPKHATGMLVGVSRVLTRRWMVGVDYSRSEERGYLTEPYKVVSVVDPTTGDPVNELSESRPDRRTRNDVLASSVYHFDRDMLYLSDRWYWDDWGIRSNTIDLKYRRELKRGNWVEPHVRYYTQTRANFFRYTLLDGADLPRYASADYRLGSLSTITLGGSYGFRIPGRPGEWTIRAEYLRQSSRTKPGDAVGNERMIDLSPPLDIGSLAVAYTIRF